MEEEVGMFSKRKDLFCFAKFGCLKYNSAATYKKIKDIKRKPVPGDAQSNCGFGWWVRPCEDP